MIPLYKFPSSPHAESHWDRKYIAEGRPPENGAAYLRQPFVHDILHVLTPGQYVLDAGCGTGGLLRFLHGRGFRVAGVDTSQAAIEIVQRAEPDIEAAIAGIEQLPFPDASFDAYLAIGSWEYPPHGPEGAAREAVRVLKPGGFLFIEVPHANVLRRLTYLPLKRLELRMQRARGQRPEFSHHFFTTADLRTVLERHGCDALDIRPHDLPERERHFGLWVDWPFLRGGPHYVLNGAGRAVKAVGNAISPWTIATGMFIVARKRS